jgi:hypothetical protein
MNNKQEVWTAMIISGYSKKNGITMAKAAELLLETNTLNYLEECYDTLHLLSNDDVICELTDMVQEELKK